MGRGSCRNLKARNKRVALLERRYLFCCRFVSVDAAVAIEPLRQLAAILGGAAYLHAAIRKKSFGVTCPSVVSRMRAMICLFGTRSRLRYRRTVSGLTPICLANSR